MAETEPHGADSRAPRVAIVTNVLSHYRVPCFQRLSEHLPGRLGIFLLTRDIPHRRYVMAQSGGRLPSETLPGLRWGRKVFDDLHLNDPRPLFRGKFDVIILGGWAEPTYLLIWLWAAIRKKKLIFWIESTRMDFKRGWLRESIKRTLLRSARGCIVPGRRAFEYCEELGVPPSKRFLAPNASDRAYFSSRAAALSPRRDDLRRDLGFSEFTVLFAGRLVDSVKGISCLIEACARLQRSGQKVTLVLVGDGPDRESYASQAKRDGLSDIRFTGTLDHDELTKYYAAVDLFVLPSRTEPWGFVLNEAMEFGLPLLVSDAVGAGPDLVVKGENGFVFPVGDAEALSSFMTRLTVDASLRLRMGRVSRERIGRFSPEQWCEGVVKAIEGVSKPEATS